MKPGKYDIKHSILITGAELEELQRHIWMMAESFGLDRRNARDGAEIRVDSQELVVIE